MHWKLVLITTNPFDRLIELGAAENEKPYSVGGDLMKDPLGKVLGLIYNPHFQLKD